jgi:hypothetical protein
MTAREKIAAKIRALRAKTVENGCTEEEAMAAAAMVAKLLEQYNMSVDEAEMRASPFASQTEQHNDHVGERVLWRVASAVAKLTGTTYWTSAPGVFPAETTFFGFAHEVEIAGYLLDLCANAMRGEQARILNGAERAYTPRQRNKLFPFLDGMTHRLAARIRAMIPPQPLGTGLMVIRNELIAQAMVDEGIDLKDRRKAPPRTDFDAYRAGQLAGDRVGLNAGVAGPETAAAGLLR